MKTIFVTKNSSDTNGTQTLTNKYGTGLYATTHDAAASAYTNLLSDAGITGYSQAGLTQAQLAANAAAVLGAAYGQTATITVATANQAAFASNLNFYIDNDQQAPVSASTGQKSIPVGAAVFTKSNTTFGALKNTILNAVSGTFDNTLTADALSKDLQGVNADTIYTVYDQQTGNYLTPSDLNSNGSIKSDLYTGDHQNAQFVVTQSTLSRDNIVATPSVDKTADNTKLNVGAYTYTTTGASGDLTKAVGVSYGQTNRTLQLNYSVTKSTPFGITQGGTAAGATFDKLFALAVNAKTGQNF